VTDLQQASPFHCALTFADKFGIGREPAAQFPWQRKSSVADRPTNLWTEWRSWYEATWSPSPAEALRSPSMNCETEAETVTGCRSDPLRTHTKFRQFNHRHCNQVYIHQNMPFQSWVQGYLQSGVCPDVSVYPFIRSDGVWHLLLRRGQKWLAAYRRCDWTRVWGTLQTSAELESLHLPVASLPTYHAPQSQWSRSELAKTGDS